MLLFNWRLCFNHNRFIISSFCYSLDGLLNGGLWTGELVEICGVPGSGKTQVCVVFKVTVTLQTKLSLLFVFITI